MVDKEFCDRVSSASLGGYEVKYNTWELCERAIQEGILGDFGEAGVYLGSHPMIMAEVAKRMDSSRKIHLYDSFEGVPKIREERDREDMSYGISEDGTLVTSGRAAASIENVRAAFDANGADISNCVFHKGWFQDVFPNEAIPTFAVLRLDVDLMESNEICMKYLYPKLSKGGYFITDDWGEGDSHPWKIEFQRIMNKLGFELPEVHPVEGQKSTAWWKK